jgi:hypothetical protein
MIEGKNPQTDERLLEWKCAIAWLPLMLVEVAQQSRQGAAATESFRNEVVAMNMGTSIHALPGEGARPSLPKS